MQTKAGRWSSLKLNQGSNKSTTDQWKGGTSRQLPRLQPMHVEIDFNLRCGITDKANDFQGVKDIGVLLLAIHHHLGMGLMVWRQDAYRDPGWVKKKKKEGKILRHQSKFLFYERESCAKLPTTIRLELTQIFSYRRDYLLEIHTINQILNTINI